MKVNPADIVSVYEGRKNRCCCGCSGTHIYHSTMTEEGETKRGYSIGGDEINDARFAEIIALMNRHESRLKHNVAYVELTLDKLYLAYRRKHITDALIERRRAGMAKLTADEITAVSMES